MPPDPTLFQYELTPAKVGEHLDTNTVHVIELALPRIKLAPLP